jgi:hypothetical protein
MADFLDEQRQQITTRLSELKPLVDEYSRLEAAAVALEEIGTSTPTPAVERRRGRPPGSRPRRAATKRPAPTATAKPAGAGTRRRAGRRKGSGARSAQALEVIQGQPGITIPEIAAKMGIKQNYLYRVLPALEQEGKTKKKGRGWHAKGQRSPA